MLREDLIDPNVLSRLMALSLHARGPMIGSVSGMHRSPVKGSSLEFSEYRKYVPGDDLRRLDWRAWGRSDRYYIKEFEADTNLRLVFLVDVSGSMKYGEEGATRLDFAKRLAATLAHVAAHQGDAVGLWTFGEPDKDAETDPIYLPARRGASHLGIVLDHLADIQPSGTTTLAKSLHEAAERIPQRALIVLFSDLFTPTPELDAAIQHLRFRKHDIALFHLLDKQELEFNFDRPARFVDLEGAEPILADPEDIARTYREAVGNWLTEIDDLITTTGIDYHRLQLQDDYAEALASFLLARHK